MLATHSNIKGTKPCIPIFSYGKKTNLCQRGNGPTKYATAPSIPQINPLVVFSGRFRKKFLHCQAIYLSAWTWFFVTGLHGGLQKDSRPGASFLGRVRADDRKTSVRILFIGALGIIPVDLNKINFLIELIYNCIYNLIQRERHMQ